VDVLEHLTEEHRKAEAMVEQLAQSSEGPERRRTLSELKEALSTHMAVEERFVYPIVEKAVGREEEQGAENEHELTRAGLQQMEDLVDEPGFGAAVESLKAGLAHHVDEEENDIFPKLREAAQDEVLALGSPDELEEKVKAQGSQPSGGSNGSNGSGEPTKEELYEMAKEQDVPGRSQMSKDELREAVGKR